MPRISTAPVVQSQPCSYAPRFLQGNRPSRLPFDLALDLQEPRRMERVVPVSAFLGLLG